MSDNSNRNNGTVNSSVDNDFQVNDNSQEYGTQVPQLAIHGANATVSGLQTSALQEAMNNFATALNESVIAKSTGLPVRTSTDKYKGFIAEEYHKLTLKINALAKGIPDWQLGAYTKGALPDGTQLSPTDPEVDIAVFTRKHPWSPPEQTAKYQSKMHNNAADYAKDINNPKYKNVDFVGGAGQGVNETVSVNVGGKRISSDPITPDQSKLITDKAKAQQAPEYHQIKEKKAELNQVKLNQAVALGAATGAILTTVQEIIHVIKERNDLPEDQWIKSIQHILCGTAEGGIRGGAIAGSVQLLGKALGKEIAENALGAVPAMAIANASVDFAKDLYKLFVTQSIDADDLLCNTINNTFSSFAGFGGAWAGAQIAGSYVSVQTAVAVGASIGSAAGPIGSLIGSVIGGLVIGYGASLIIGTANNDAQKAFNQCISDISVKVEQTGCDTLYYYADTLSELSEFRLSFKNLLPCYNLISDLREYNLRKKAIKHIHTQLDDQINQIESSKRDALEQLAKQHAARLNELESFLKTQRIAMFDEFNDSMETYISNAYVQYLATFAFFENEISQMNTQLALDNKSNQKHLQRLRSRKAANTHLNEILNELMEDPLSAHLVKPFVKRIYQEMQKDELSSTRQYLSYQEAISIQGVS